MKSNCYSLIYSSLPMIVSSLLPNVTSEWYRCAINNIWPPQLGDGFLVKLKEMFRVGVTRSGWGDTNIDVDGIFGNIHQLSPVTGDSLSCQWSPEHCVITDWQNNFHLLVSGWMIIIVHSISQTWLRGLDTWSRDLRLGLLNQTVSRLMMGHLMVFKSSDWLIQMSGARAGTLGATRILTQALTGVVT